MFLFEHFLNEHLPHRWIRRIGQNDNVLMKWPPQDLKPYDFFWLGFVKDNVYTYFHIIYKYILLV